jgi:hypothetical protein
LLENAWELIVQGHFARDIQVLVRGIIAEAVFAEKMAFSPRSCFVRFEPHSLFARKFALRRFIHDFIHRRYSKTAATSTVQPRVVGHFERIATPERGLKNM